MRTFELRSLVAAAFAAGALCLTAAPAQASDITWNGAGANPTVGANWNGGVAPGAADVAIISSSPNAPDFASQTVTWGRLRTNFANNIGDTGGAGVLNLTGADNSQFFSEGTGHLSTVAVDIVATKNIQTNGAHSVTFNGNVTAAKLEAFGGSTGTYNGVTTQTDEFMSIGGGSKIVINGEFHWNNANHGINNNPTVELGPNAKLFRSGNVAGLDVWNIYDGATVRLLANNALGTSGETDIWSRNTTNNFDMNGFNQFVEFFGMGDAPAALNINFATPGPNTLIWDASHGMNGTGLYNVLNFQPGIDTLEFGQHGANDGFRNPTALARIRINGAPYSATPLPSGSWWTLVPTPSTTDDPNRRIVSFQIPEPSALALVAMALAAVGCTRRTNILR